MHDEAAGQFYKQGLSRGGERSVPVPGEGATAISFPQIVSSRKKLSYRCAE